MNNAEKRKIVVFISSSLVTKAFFGYLGNLHYCSSWNCNSHSAQKKQLLSKNELEKEVAQERPDLKPKESQRRVSKSFTRVTTDVEDHMVAKWKKIQDMVSSRLGRTVSLAEAQEAIADDYILRNDSLIKARKAEQRKVKKIAKAQKQETEVNCVKSNVQKKSNAFKSLRNLCPGPKIENKQSSNSRIAFTAAEKHGVILKTGGGSTFVPNHFYLSNKEIQKACSFYTNQRFISVSVYTFGQNYSHICIVEKVGRDVVVVAICRFITLSRCQGGCPRIASISQI